MSNKAKGSEFEREFAQTLSNYGYWVHNMALNKNGQPADLIAVRDGMADLIDCKLCENDTFPLKRVEENQKSAMYKWFYCHNGQGWFALKVSSGIYMIDFSRMIALSERKAKLTLDDIEFNGIKFVDWNRSNYDRVLNKQ